MKKEISLEERKQIQLKMLQEIHEFCSSHGIRYSLAYGTLIGAIRHKGFIPWDDDVDIMMPLPDMLKFKREFTSNQLKYLDVDTEKHFCYGFSRIGYNPTYRKIGIIGNEYGINIDLYIVISVPDDKIDRLYFFKEGSRLFNRRMFYMKWNGRLMKCLPHCTIPGYDNVMKEYRDYLLFNSIQYGSSSLYYVIGGPLNPKEIDMCTYNYDLFSSLIEVDFEYLKLCSISCYHDFLTHYYGDYMELPPEEQRHPYHSGHYYWK